MREHGQGQEEKSRNVQREPLISRRWPGKTPEQKRLEEEIERKWEEFEHLPVKPVVSLSALGSLQREVERADDFKFANKASICKLNNSSGVCVCVNIANS